MADYHNKTFPIALQQTNFFYTPSAIPTRTYQQHAPSEGILHKFSQNHPKIPDEIAVFNHLRKPHSVPTIILMEA